MHDEHLFRIANIVNNFKANVLKSNDTVSIIWCWIIGIKLREKLKKTSYWKLTKLKNWGIHEKLF